jgi:phage terminase small subunit
MTELESCIHFFEAELKPPRFLNPATSALFQSTVKFLKQFEDITTRFPTLRLKSIPGEGPQ